MREYAPLPLQAANTNNISIQKNAPNSHNQSLRTPIIHRNHPKIHTPRASPDAAEERKTIRRRERLVDEPTENEKRRPKDETHLAGTPATKVSWSA